MFATFEGVTERTPEDDRLSLHVIPWTYMMMYGEAGVAGAGTLCGALNGAAAAIFLIAGGIKRNERKEHRVRHDQGPVYLV